MSQTLHGAKRVDIEGACGQSLECRVLGTGRGSTVILTSGIGCGPVFMEAVAAELARDHRVVYWNYRGHGASAPAPRGCGYSVRDHARDLDAVVRTFAGNEAPVMVGFSMGVQVTIEWARMRPDAAQAFVFMLGVPRNPLQRTRILGKLTAQAIEQLASRVQPLLALGEPLVRGSFRSLPTYSVARALGAVQATCPPDAFEDFVRFATDVPLDAYLRCAAGLLAHDATEAFRALRQPVLMLAGERDVLVSEDECRAYAAQLPQAEYVMLPGGSHASALELGDNVARRVRSFLEARRDALPLAA